MTAPTYVETMGLECVFYVNTGTYGSPTWVPCNLVKDMTLTLEKSEADASARATLFKLCRGGQIAASADGTMIYNTADAGWAALHTAFHTPQPVECLILDGLVVAPVGGTASQGLRSVMEVLKFGRNEDLENVVATDFSVKPTGSANPPSWFTGTVAT